MVLRCAVAMIREGLVGSSFAVASDNRARCRAGQLGVAWRSSLDVTAIIAPACRTMPAVHN